MSEHKSVYAALAAAQSEMGKATKDAENPHFKSKYADLSAVVDAVRPSLNKHGIAYFHIPEQGEFGHAMKTVLYHGGSDTSITASVPLILGKQDMWGYKSATTYAKRIGLESVTGIAPEDDDDGSAAVGTGAEGMSVKTKGDAGQTLSWSQEVLKDMPEAATDKEKARALTDAIIAQWKRKKTQTQLDNEWNRRRKTIDFITEKFPEMGEEIREAFEVQVASFPSSESIAAE